MKVPHSEGLSNHIGPESCVYNRAEFRDIIGGINTIVFIMLIWNDKNNESI